uniref:enolase C-terminal domain-like protein n=1 Tax=Acidisphaera sp. L21 TaxID=1641851 RepID=UPI001C20A555
PLLPNAAFAALQAASPIPILVDMPCISVADATRFLSHGANSLSVKPGRVGITEASRITALAEAAGAAVCAGMYAEGALGTLISLQFAAGLKHPLMPAEQSFFLLMREQILHQPLHVRDGHIELPDGTNWDALVDWDRVRRFAIA